MLTLNLNWLVNTRFVCASYPDVAASVLSVIKDATGVGVSRWELTDKCPGIAIHKMRITIGQLEQYGVIVNDERTYSLASATALNVVIDRINSSEARILAALTESGGQALTISGFYGMERSQAHPALCGLIKKGYVGQKFMAGGRGRPKMHYTLQPLSGFYMSAFLSNR